MVHLTPVRPDLPPITKSANAQINGEKHPLPFLVTTPLLYRHFYCDQILKHLGLEVLDVGNLRSMLDVHAPVEGSLEPQIEALLNLKQRGLVRHIGLSNVTEKQVRDARAMTPVACVQNLYNLANRQDETMINLLSADGIPYVPFFPLGGFSPLQSKELNGIAETLNATPSQVALAWLLQRSPNILLIPGTSSPEHLKQNLASGDLVLPTEVIQSLNCIG